MKAKIITTGEIVDVQYWYHDNTGELVYAEVPKSDRSWIEKELDFNIEPTTKKIDWEQRRFELIKAIMQGLSANPYEDIVKMDEEEFADLAISYADAVIAKLKE